MSVAPLRDLLVVDLTRHLPGPLAARLLKDLGARVVKVEEPGLGDPVRLAPPMRAGQGALAAMLLAGLESVALDLAQEPARRVLLALLGRADVLLESFRPGTLAGLGLAPRSLRERFPRLVICSLSGWGQEGPHARRAGHDLTYQALAGSLGATGRMPNLPAADLLGGWSAATAVLAALRERDRTGQGTWIDAALLDAAAHGAVMAWAEEVEGPARVGEPGLLTGGVPAYNLYPTRGGELIALAALERPFWRRLCEALGRPDLVRGRLSRDPAVRREVARLAAGRTREEWAAFFAEHDLPGEPVLAPSESRRHEQVRTRAVVGEGSDGLPRLGFPALFDGERPRAAGRLARLGEQTVALLEELGFRDEARSRRRRRRGGIGPRRRLRRLLARLRSS